MIYLKKGQALVDNPTMVVYDPTGYYNDGDSIICASSFQPEEPVCRYEAKFVAYGGLVYSVSDEDELMDQILKLDPKSLFGKDSQQVAVDKVVENIVPQAEGVVPVEEVEKVEVKEEVEEVATTTPAVVNPIVDTSTSTTTPAVTATTTPGLNLSTTTPDFIVPDVNLSATTTPPEILFPDTAISTTTPEVLLPEDLSTANATSSNATTTEAVPAVEIPPVLETPTNTSTTTGEVVAFAKKLVKNKISKKLGL